MSRPRPYYDPKRPASIGRWVAVTHKTRGFVIHTTFRTEYEARKAVGLRGGSKDPRYVPDGTR